MKNHVMAYALSALMLTTVLPAAHAAVPGVPVLDPSNLLALKANALAQAKQAMDALSTAKDAITQTAQQYNHYKSIITGNDMLGGFLNDPALNKVMPLGDWADVYSTGRDIASLRDRYGLTSDNASVQAKFDQMMSAADALERNYNASTERVKNAELLRARLNEVQTPQQKEDLQLRYQQELIEQQNQQMRLANMQMLQQQQEKMENEKRAQAFRDYMRGKTSVRPSYE
ncbi:P-type DNA transfer protein VirB5 [Pseudomonas syringae pv. tagetis]|uniref:VirB5 n=2 Tax=Pseudomonas syringae group TaxID=136849 RepID=Q6VE85_PSESY|nr:MULTISPECIES: P-type DNA transfer protein VirB5 [Pseudomonas syringae group]AAR02176.1 VirB5 [Pseudomonas syringae pv. syringae]KWS10992.1 conjugal transfer protein [Pseudomonas syringae pv. syringae]MCK9694848.1 P-type DNA transfer protein VirB5 [Pseudomonas syringae pv. syringae]MDC3744129.1 P-type DNA transfer protein VirB5 [Pseudomonas syringae pv. syringae]POD15097.1 P-type DNA transfer protein VirB5 [Pseudomonas syringae pv. syringae]